LKAQLRTTGAMCYSACVYAFLGGSTRKVPAGTRLGVHASVPTAASQRPGAPTPQELHNARKRYVLEMGVNPGLVDFSRRFSGIHVLNRDEIAEFGIETGVPFETEWMPYEERSSKRQFMLKAITHVKGMDSSESRTVHIRIACAGSRPSTWLTYHREIPSNEVGVPIAVRLTFGGNRVSLDRGPAKPTSDQHSTFVDREFARKALAAGSIAFTETLTPRNAQARSREIKLSTAGLEQALQTSLKNCGAQ
jgi:hypothetical protein